jgi:hypothetical protein
MTLEELKTAVGPAALANAVIYGPAVLQMAEADARKWIQFVFVGDTIGAYKLFLKSTNPDGVGVLQSLDQKWTDAVNANAAKVALQEEIATAIAKAMLPLVLAMVGL